MKKQIHAFGSWGAILSGFAHLFYKTISHGHVLPHVLFFAGMGILQIWWGWRFLTQQKFSSNFLQVGVAINGGFALMWFLTRFIAPPFMSAPEEFNLIGWGVAVLEIISLIAIYLQKAKEKNHWKSQLVEAFLVVGLVLATTFALFGGGKMGEAFFPSLMGQGHHHGSDHH